LNQMARRQSGTGGEKGGKSRFGGRRLHQTNSENGDEGFGKKAKGNDNVGDCRLPNCSTHAKKQKKLRAVREEPEGAGRRGAYETQPERSSIRNATCSVVGLGGRA